MDIGPGTDISRSTSGVDLVAAKNALRRRVRAARQSLSPPDIDSARRAVAALVIARCEAQANSDRAWRTVLGFEPFDDEPGSLELLAALREHGCEIYVPTRLADDDLSWHRWGEATRRADAGAVGRADAVLVPAFAVDRLGRRLGRGGGSYDRVLPRVPSAATVVALVHRGEFGGGFGGGFGGAVPAASWDVPVRAVVDPDGWTDLPATG